MKNITLLLLMPFFVVSQQIFDSQIVYQDLEGLFDESIVRDLSLNFYDSDYNDFLIDSWFSNTKLKKLLALT